MKNIALHIIVAVITGLAIIAVVGFVIIYYWPQNDQNPSHQTLKEGWVYQPSTLCNVDFPLPPRTSEYMTDKGEYWRFQENTQDQGNPFFSHTAIAILQNPELGGSGYVAGAVIVSCKPNTENIDAQTLFNHYQTYFETINQTVPEEAQITLTQEETTNLWGREVLVVHFSGGMFNPDDKVYLFTTPNFTYAVSKPQHSTDPNVAQTTREVLEKLNFR